MAAIHKSVDVAGLAARLGAIRLRFSPGSTLRSFGRVVGDERWRKWEAGDVPGEARLAAALSRLPGVDGLALAKWAREGTGDMPSGAGAGSARPAEPSTDLVSRHVLRLWDEIEALPEEVARRLRPLVREIARAAGGTSPSPRAQRRAA